MGFYLFIAFWIVCGILGYGATIGYFENEYPTVPGGNEPFAVVVAAGGPLGLLVAWVMSGGFRHGFQWRS